MEAGCSKSINNIQSSNILNDNINKETEDSIYSSSGCFPTAFRDLRKQYKNCLIRNVNNKNKSEETGSGVISNSRSVHSNSLTLTVNESEFKSKECMNKQSAAIAMLELKKEEGNGDCCDCDINIITKNSSDTGTGSLDSYSGLKLEHKNMIKNYLQLEHYHNNDFDLTDHQENTKDFLHTAVENEGRSQDSEFGEFKMFRSGTPAAACHVCGRLFKNSESLRTHLKSHGRHRTFRCDFCGKSFNKSCNLVEHMRIHTGEKRYKCDICHIAFTHSSTLHKHKVTHTYSNSRRDKIPSGDSVYVKSESATKITKKSLKHFLNSKDISSSSGSNSKDVVNILDSGSKDCDIILDSGSKNSGIMLDSGSKECDILDSVSKDSGKTISDSGSSSKSKGIKKLKLNNKDRKRCSKDCDILDRNSRRKSKGRATTSLDNNSYGCRGNVVMRLQLNADDDLEEGSVRVEYAVNDDDQSDNENDKSDDSDDDNNKYDENEVCDILSLNKTTVTDTDADINIIKCAAAHTHQNDLLLEVDECQQNEDNKNIGIVDNNSNSIIKYMCDKSSLDSSSSDSDKKLARSTSNSTTVNKRKRKSERGKRKKPATKDTTVTSTTTNSNNNYKNLSSINIMTNLSVPPVPTVTTRTPVGVNVRTGHVFYSSIPLQQEAVLGPQQQCDLREGNYDDHNHRRDKNSVGTSSVCGTQSSSVNISGTTQLFSVSVSDADDSDTTIVFRCDICKKTYSKQRSLTKHLATHSAVGNPRKCAICDKTFQKVWNLAEHMRIHTGEKPFKCEICGKAFTHSSTMQRHTKTHFRKKGK